jgi:hypothetical protein
VAEGLPAAVAPAPALLLVFGLAVALALEPGVCAAFVLALAPGLGGMGAAKAVPGTANGRAGRDSSATAATGARRLPVLVWEAGTEGNVPGEGVGVAPPFGRSASTRPEPAAPVAVPPARRAPPPTGDTDRMKLSRPVSWFLLAFGVWSWVIWITFVKNLWKDGSGLAFDDAGDPTAYFWVHLTLAVVSFVLGTVVGGIGLRGLRALRRTA